MCFWHTDCKIQIDSLPQRIMECTMTRYSLFTAFIAIGMPALLLIEAFAEDYQPLSRKTESTCMVNPIERPYVLVDFKDQWTFSPKTKLWSNASGELLSADELLKQGQISLRVVSSTTKPPIVACKSSADQAARSKQDTRHPFSGQGARSSIRMWDETKPNKIRIMFTGLMPSHSVGNP